MSIPKDRWLLRLGLFFLLILLMPIHLIVGLSQTFYGLLSNWYDIAWQLMHGDLKEINLKVFH